MGVLIQWMSNHVGGLPVDLKRCIVPNIYNSTWVDQRVIELNFVARHIHIL